jgi:hypothetical protein
VSFLLDIFLVRYLLVKLKKDKGAMQLTLSGEILKKYSLFKARNDVYEQLKI